MLRTYTSIFRVGLALIGIPIVFQLAALGYLLHVQEETRTAERWEMHSKDVIRQASALSTRIEQAHSALRAMNIFEDVNFEEQDRRPIDGLPAAILSLRKLVSDNPGQQRQLDRLLAQANSYVTWFHSVEQMARRQDWNMYREEFLSLRGKKQMDGVEQALGSFMREEERLDRLRLQAAADARFRERLVLMLMGAFAVVLAVAMLAYFSRSLSARVTRVAINADRLATGEPLLDPLPGQDQVAGLDAVLHHSASRLAAAAEAERRYTDELRRSQDALERTNKDLLFRTQENEMFVYSVSHDLRSPLVNLQGFTRELTRAFTELHAMLSELELPAPVRGRLATLVDGDMGESIGFIQTAVTRLSGIVDALLRLSRAGRVEFSAVPVDLTAVLGRVVRSLHLTIVDKAAEVVVEPLPVVSGDPIALEQVFANLIGNALNYLDPGRPGRIRIGTADPEQASQGTIYVRDNGLGIPAQWLSKVFLPFERLHGATVKGEGIGLALVKRIVGRHNGAIRVESTEHEGTTFYVSLPLAEAARPGTSAVAAIGEVEARR